MGGDLIREARRRAGLTQSELARRAGTTQSAVARWESGRSSPSFDTVLRLLRLCGFRLDVALDPWDGSDIWQARRLQDMDVDERLSYLTSTVGLYRRMRADAQASMRHAG